jgi:hypothetical protein
MSVRQSGVVPAGERGAAGRRVPAEAGLEVSFLLRSLRQLRYYESTIEALVDRADNVTLLMEFASHGGEEQRWLDRIAARPNFRCEVVEKNRWDPWAARRRAVQAAMEYVHFLGPAYRDRQRYVLNVLGRRLSPPRAIRALARLPLLRTDRGLKLLYRCLCLVDQAFPADRRADAWIERLRPDIVVAADAGSRALFYESFVTAATRRGIPTLGLVSSWDNLTTRPPLRVRAHRLVVWNETQRREAVAIHDMPPERVTVTGAPGFDQWFRWRARPAREFLARVGLDPQRPVVLWVSSALNPWEPSEAPLVERWIAALRADGDPVLRGVGVLVRPHPLRLGVWSHTDLDRHENVALWPRGDMSMPIGAEQKADYFDSIFHSRAVVGINTSAMIEASIVGRPVLSILDPDYHDSQLGALHFSYLLEAGGGVLRLARSMEEHLDDLRTLVAGENRAAVETTRAFVASFVRPHGLEQPATPIVVDSVRELAGAEIAPEPASAWVPILRAVVVAAYLPFVPVLWLRDRKRRRRLRKAIVRRLLLPLRWPYVRAVVRRLAVVRRVARGA